MPRFVAICRTASCFLVALLIVSAARAQTLPMLGSDRFDAVASDVSPSPSFVSTMPIALEGALDSRSYVVGPGDVFRISVSGVQSVVAELPVSADGTLIVPEVGSIAVDGLTLSDATTQIRETIRSSYRRSTVDVALGYPRRFVVHVSGSLPRPGSYVATATTRASSMVMLALQDTTGAIVVAPPYRPALRNVTITRRDGSLSRVDVREYLRAGSTVNNPYLLDGDVITVPAYDPHTQSVFVSGAAPYRGGYDFRPGDTIESVLVVAMGVARPVVSGRVRLSRQEADDTVTEQIFEGSSDLWRSVALQPMDQIHVSAAVEMSGTAVAEGYVRFPGEYAMREGRTRLKDLLELAGGVDPNGLARAAYIERFFADQTATASRLASTPRIRTGVDTLDAYRKLRLSTFRYPERDHFTKELVNSSRISVDLSTPHVLEETFIRNGDRLIVPRDHGTVLVFGQVNRPGYIPVSAGTRADDFIRAAGGLASGAGAVSVIEAGTSQHLLAGSATVASGDMVFVAPAEIFATSIEQERLLFDERRLRSDNRGRIIQTVLSAVATTSSILALILAVRK